MKKNFKNAIALMAAFVLAMSLAACGGGTDAGSDADTDGQDVSDNGDDASEKGMLIMGTNAEFPPYEYHEGSEIVGIDAEIAKAIADKLGYDFKVEDMAFDSIIPAVQSGKISFGMAGMTVTEDRLQSVDFSDSYATGVQVVIVAEDSEITTVDDLFVEGASHFIGVQTGTTGDLYATWDIEDEGLGTIERYNKGAEAVQSLKLGKIDCVIIDNEPAKEFVAAVEGLKILDTAYAEEDYAICFAKDDALKDEVNGALNELIEDGTVQAILDKYISAE